MCVCVSLFVCVCVYVSLPVKQACLVTNLFIYISYNIKAKSRACVCVYVSLWVCVSLPVKKLIFTTHLLTPWVWMTGSTFSRITTMIPISRDFTSILDLDLYGEHMHEERITGSKIGLDISAGTRVYTVWTSASAGL